MKIADLLPAHIRKAIYTVLGAVIAVEAVVDVIPDVFEGRALLVLAALGFTLAAGNTKGV